MSEARSLRDICSDLDRSVQGVVARIVLTGGMAAHDKQLLNALAEQVENAKANIETSRLERWRNAVGENLGILDSPASAVTYFYNSDPNVRVVAISVASKRWPLDPQVAAQCERLAVEEPDNYIRAVAAVSLGTCYAGSCNERISFILGSIAAAEAIDFSVRRSAYVGLLMAQGVDLLLHEPSLEDAEHFPIPQGMNMELVRRFTAPPLTG